MPRLAEACDGLPLVIKGPAVAESLYEPRMLRPFADLDLLVSRSKLEAAAKALTGLGYRPNLHLRPGFAERHRHDLHFNRLRGSQAIGIDLHWRVSDDRLGDQLTYERIEPAPLTIDGVPMACPSPPDQLLVLSTHFLTDRLRTSAARPSRRTTATGQPRSSAARRRGSPGCFTGPSTTPPIIGAWRESGRAPPVRRPPGVRCARSSGFNCRSPGSRPPHLAPVAGATRLSARDAAADERGAARGGRRPRHPGLATRSATLAARLQKCPHGRPVSAGAQR